MSLWPPFWAFRFALSSAAMKERKIEPNCHRILFARRASDQITHCFFILFTIVALSVAPVLSNSNKGHQNTQWQQDSIVNDVSILFSSLSFLVENVSAPLSLLNIVTYCCNYLFNLPHFVTDAQGKQGQPCNFYGRGRRIDHFG